MGHSISSADTITLTSGKEYDCEIISFENNSVKFVSDGRELSAKVKMISDIETLDPKKTELVEKILEKVNKFAEKKQAREDSFRDRILSKKVDVYVISNCGWSVKMIEYLDEKGIKYNYYNCDYDLEANRRFKSFKTGRGFPTVVINDSVIIPGYAPDRVWEELTK
jgi:glutaredoxin